MRIKPIAVAGVLLTILAVSSAVVRIYTSYTDSYFLRILASNLRLPFAKIDGHTVSFTSLYRQQAALRALNNDATLPFTDAVWSKIQSDFALERLFTETGNVWNQKDFEDFVAGYIESNFETPDEISEIISPLTVEEFTKFVLRPLYLRQAVTKQLIMDTENVQYQEINGLYELAQQNPEGFRDLVSNYLTEQHINTAPQVVILSADELPPDTVALFKTLKTGDLTPIIAMPDGYHVYKILNFFENPQLAWQAEELFIPSNAFAEKLDIARQSLHVKVYNPSILNRNE